MATTNNHLSTALRNFRRDGSGSPQLGHFSALCETDCPHSRHLTSAIEGTFKNILLPYYTFSDSYQPRKNIWSDS